MRLLDALDFKQVLRFGAVGIFNTLVGYAAIFALMHFLNVSPLASNAIVYLLGIILSYGLHRTITFRSRQKKTIELPKFVVVFVVAYLLNAATLFLLVNEFHMSAYLAQAIAGVVYVTTSFMSSKLFVFINRNERIKNRLGD